ncbi:hypothetical protein KM043_005441 [Ampulex compressa]|nr:hypothetical protein KM043_005441 [Ampulex compressa]
MLLEIMDTIQLLKCRSILLNVVVLIWVIVANNGYRPTIGPRQFTRDSLSAVESRKPPALYRRRALDPDAEVPEARTPATGLRYQARRLELRNPKARYCIEAPEGSPGCA